MKCLVTGACGFIGSHLCEALRDAGHDVTGMVWLQGQGRHVWLGEVEGVKKTLGDVRHAADLRSHLRDQDYVFHLAAEIDVAESYKRPADFLSTNLWGTMQVLDAAKEFGFKLIHTSSSEVYGTAQYTPQDEEHPLQAQSPYAASKIAADSLVESYRRSFGVRAVTLRPFNTYGPRQSEQAVIGRMMRQLGEKPMVLGNLKTWRDFTYVTDTVRAFLAVMDLEGEIYNCGTGRSVKIGDIAKSLAAKHGGLLVRSDPERHRPERSEVWELRCDYEKLHKATGWQPMVDLKQGLELTRQWHEDTAQPA